MKEFDREDWLDLAVMVLSMVAVACLGGAVATRTIMVQVAPPSCTGLAMTTGYCQTYMTTVNHHLRVLVSTGATLLVTAAVLQWWWLDDA